MSMWRFGLWASSSSFYVSGRQGCCVLYSLNPRRTTVFDGSSVEWKLDGVTLQWQLMLSAWSQFH